MRARAEDFYGKRIVAASFDGEVNLVFEDGKRLRLADDGQSCCEARYMRTDDDVPSIVGQTLRGIERVEAAQPEVDENEDSRHEVCFLEIRTDKEVIQFSFHNEHNGYYGGFCLSIETSEKVKP